MKMSSVLLMSIAFVCQGMVFADAQKSNTETLFSNDKPPLIQTAQEQEQKEVEVDRNQCWSAKNCSGKILNNKDAHNCKLSGGKSWRSKTTGQCTNL